MTELVIRHAGALWRGFRNWDAVWLTILAIPLALIALDPGRAGQVLSTAVRAFSGTMPFMAMAIGLIAWLKATGAEGIVARAFVGREARMILLAALVGGLMPFCSCEVIPFIAALLAAGTPVSAVMAFWLSSPLMDPPQFMITTGALGLEFAVAKMVFAVMIGLAGGFAMQALTQAGAFAEPLRARKTCGSCCSADALTGQPFWRFWEQTERRETFRATAFEQTIFLTKWLSLAYLLEGLLIEYIPAGDHRRAGRRARRLARGAGRAGRRAGLSERLRRAAAGGRADAERHERRGGYVVHDCRCGELHPGHGRGLGAGQARGLRHVCGLRDRRRDRRRADLRGCDGGAGVVPNQPRHAAGAAPGQRVRAVTRGAHMWA
jgi:uncharacterized membrane protein YraQ (UPF0718 family)